MVEPATKGTHDASTAVDDESIRPFQIQVPQEALDDRRPRIEAMRWPDRETVDDPTQGVTSSAGSRSCSS